MDDHEAMPLSTKTGDDGTTGLLFGGRVSKTDPVIEVVGAIDEAVAALGLARALLVDRAAGDAAGTLAGDAAGAVAGDAAGAVGGDQHGSRDLGALVLALQRGLFVVAADAAAAPRARDRLVSGVSLVTAEMTAALEDAIDDLLAAHPLRPAFVVPGANPASAALDLARGRLRTAERRLVAAREAGAEIGDDLLAYVNRASDLVYALARRAAGEAEEELSHGAVG
jgi:cob(I)alamin adenosyltransferase